MELISDEREFSDEENKFTNHLSIHGELGYEDVPVLSSAHSKRSRQMDYEAGHGWDDNYHPHRDSLE